MNLTEVRSGFNLSSPKSKLLQIECLQFVAFFMLFVLLTTRFLRRRYNSKVLKFLAVGANTTILLLIPFIFGLMLNLDLKNGFVPVWATVLVFVYASVPDVVDFRRGLHVGVAFVKFSLYAIYSCLLVFRLYKYSMFNQSVIMLLMLSLYQTLEKIYAPASATSVTNEVRRTCLLRSISKCLEDRLNVDDNTPASDDATLLRCTYLVDPNIRRLSAGKIDDPGMTLDKIWSCKDGWISSPAGGPKHELKNTCLALSLFWMLLHNFAGVPSYESSHPEEALKFVRDGLLTFTRPLELIEIELAFLGDFFFGKYFYAFYHFGLLLLIIRQFLFVGAVSLALSNILVDYTIGVEHGFTPEIHGHDRDVIATGIIIILTALLQLGQAIVLCNSRWAKVRLICLYVRRESWKKKTISDRCINGVARILSPVRYQVFKPWQRKLGQYSLLMQSRKSMRSYRIFQTLTGIRLGRPGRKEGDAKILSDEIQMIVIQTLKDRGHDLTNGMRSLEKSSLPGETKRKLILECKLSSKLDTDARVVLVWHIATSVCEINPQLPSTAAQCSDFRVATTLSKYSAYLVAFAPDLLPGNAAATTFTCSDAIDEAYERLKDCGSSNRYDKLMDIANEDRDELEASQRILDTSIVQQGAVLGKVLETEIAEACQRWKVLADFWAEMILYLAPNATNQWAHVEKLEDGGEFITHLWALLYHAGIVDRDPFHKSESDAGAELKQAQLD